MCTQHTQTNTLCHSARFNIFKIIRIHTAKSSCVLGARIEYSRKYKLESGSICALYALSLDVGKCRVSGSVALVCTDGFFHIHSVCEIVFGLSENFTTTNSTPVAAVTATAHCDCSPMCFVFILLQLLGTMRDPLLRVYELHTIACMYRNSLHIQKTIPSFLLMAPYYTQHSGHANASNERMSAQGAQLMYASF